MEKVYKLGVFQGTAEEVKSLLIRKYLEENKTLREIGKELGVTHERVRQLLKRLRIKRKNRGRLSKTDVVNFEEVLKLYEHRKLPLAEIGRRCGVSAYTIAKVLKNNGVKLRRRGWIVVRRRKFFLNDEDKEVLRKMYLERKMSTQKIARRFGVSPITVYRKLKEMGVPTRWWLSLRLRKKQEASSCTTT